MLSVLKNDWNRMLQQKVYMIVAIGLTLCSVVLAVVLTNKLESKLNIAVVGGQLRVPEISGLAVTYLDEKPAESSLVKNRYDAVISYDAETGYQIDTTKNDQFKQKLESALAGNSLNNGSFADGRQIGTNIMGYMLMFLLMQGVLYARLFAEDKEKHMMERITMSPVSFYKYLFGHIIFIWVLVMVPSFLVIAGADVLGVTIGFALWQYAILIGILSFLSTCFAICLNSFFCNADTANMAGTSIIVLTSMLAGSFYDMGDKGSLFDKLLCLLPQKDFVYFTTQWEKNLINSKAITSIVYVIICSAVFITVGVLKTRKDYIYHRS